MTVSSPRSENVSANAARSSVVTSRSASLACKSPSQILSTRQTGTVRLGVDARRRPSCCRDGSAQANSVDQQRCGSVHLSAAATAMSRQRFSIFGGSVRLWVPSVGGHVARLVSDQVWALQNRPPLPVCNCSRSSSQLRSRRL
jgi:hypothetical protein